MLVFLDFNNPFFLPSDVRQRRHVRSSRQPGKTRIRSAPFPNPNRRNLRKRQSYHPTLMKRTEAPLLETTMLVLRKKARVHRLPRSWPPTRGRSWKETKTKSLSYANQARVRRRGCLCRTIGRRSTVFSRKTWLAFLRVPSASQFFELLARSHLPMSCPDHGLLI